MNNQEFNLEIIISLIALIVSVVSFIVAKRNMQKVSKWQEQDIQLRQKNEEEKKLAPYIQLVHDTYCSFDDIFSNYSRTANIFLDKIVNLADSYNNSKGTNKHALRHHMVYASDEIIKKHNEDILFQHPEYLFNNLLNGKYRKLDYKLDLKGKNSLGTIEAHLKILNENIDSDKKHLYLQSLIELTKIVYQIYYDNKEKIDNSIKELEKAMIKYKHFDFDTTINSFYLEFNGLLNLLRYIKEISTTYTREFDEEFTFLNLSEILYKITSIMIVNEGILKLHKY